VAVQASSVAVWCFWGAQQKTAMSKRSKWKAELALMLVQRTKKRPKTDKEFSSFIKTTPNQG
jgi:hypothetical protein